MDSTPVSPSTDPASPEAEAALFPVVGVGASAGGLEALTALLRHLPAQPHLALVVVQHLDPSHPSSLVELLAREATMAVREVTDGTAVEVDQVYVIPPRSDLTLQYGVFRLTPRVSARVPHFPIDAFLRSLAEDRGDRAIGVILSGTGTDGTLGLKAIRSAGGTTFAQDDSAKFDGMPKSAVTTGCVDAVLAPEAIAAALVRMGRNTRHPPHSPSDDADDLTGLFRAIRNVTRVDFAGYKIGTVSRRVQRRMTIHKFDRVIDYVRYVEANPTEARALFEDMLIHVTSFFRDPDTFEALKTDVFPVLLVDRPADSPIRVWVPGCSTGEEVYSLAITLLEFLGDKTTPPIKLFGTDLSDTAVESARAGRYPASIATDVSPDRLRRFFVAADGGYQITQTVRDLCVFARHDVTRDPPFNNMDLVSCRNVLIYLGPDLQKRVLPVIHYALKPTGRLVLGSSETVSLLSDLFATVNAKHRIYSRKAVTTRTILDFASPELVTGLPAQGFHLSGLHAARSPDVFREADRVLLARHAPPGVVVNDSLEVLQFRGDTSPYLQLPLGAATLGFLKLARNGLSVMLRTALDEARSANAVVRKEGLRFDGVDKVRVLNLSVSPFTVSPDPSRYFLILFEDATPPAGDGQAPIEKAVFDAGESSRVAQLQTDLATTRASLQSAIEELEAHNEELQAANEEAVSSNEELRSTNEELQTAKEELQATNEELGTVNEELHHRIRTSTELGNDLSNLLNSVQIPIVMLGLDLRIRRFTPSASRLFSLIPGDVGRPLGDITSRLDVPDLAQLINSVIDTLAIVEREVRDRDGRWYGLNIRPYRTQDNKIDGVVLSAVDIDAVKRSEQLIAASRDYSRGIVETVCHPLMILDHDLRVVSANEAFYTTFRVDPKETETRYVYDLGNKQWDIPELRALLNEILPRESVVENYQVNHEFPGIGLRIMILNARRMVRPVSESGYILLGIEDVTDRERAKALLRESAERLQLALHAGGMGAFEVNLESGEGYWNDTEFELLGLKPGDVPPGSESFFRFVHPDDVGALRAHWADAIRMGELDAEFRVVRADGKTRWLAGKGRFLEGIASGNDLAARGRVPKFLGVNFDITPRREAAEILRDREVRLAAILNTAADAIITIDERGTISSTNPATERIFGYRSAELVGQNVKVLMPPPFHNEHDGYLARYVNTGIKRIIGIGREAQGQRKDGSIFPMELAVSEVMDGQRWFTGIIRDISRRKELEREVLESAAEEERRIGRELHDGIGQELTGLGLLAEAHVRQLGESTSTQHQSAAKLVTGLQRIHEQLRTLCRELLLAELDAEGLRAALADLAARTFEQTGVACTFDCPLPVQVLSSTTAKHLYRITQEAVSNALRHGKARQIQIGLHTTPHGLRLQIADDGAGIANGISPNWELKGLGVSTMRYRASLIGGALHISSADGGGVLVTCIVPREDDNDETDSQDGRASNQDIGGR